MITGLKNNRRPGSDSQLAGLKLKASLFFVLLTTITTLSNAQIKDCLFKDSLFHFNFGTDTKSQDFSFSALKNYRRDFSTCPNDGFFSFASKTADCFYGQWISLPEDHTPGDLNGRMMIVNASINPGTFFLVKLNGFSPNTLYEFSVWMINVCKIHNNCAPLPPDIQIELETKNGSSIAKFNTGKIVQQTSPAWKRYFGMFKTNAEPGPILMSMTNLTNGGCGNDFALDDLLIRECYPPEKPVSPLPAVAIEKKKITPVIRSITPEPDQKLEKKTMQVNIPRAKSKENSMEIIAPTTTVTVLPAPLRTRQNQLIREIITGTEEELLIELYDNGVIDGDTVSIYHNNELLVAHAGLSAKPVQLKINISKAEPYHELIMVADNLGSIPPNTSLMVVTGKNKRFEIFISSSEQQNARVVIRK